ncbi:MAG TPA: DNA mismatch endonuclease Vsr [Tepidisphaeraceae bacterium]|jgi:DNA mismatch endonuclease (patch repair protein)
MADNLTPVQRRACMQSVKGRDTTPELAVRSVVHRLGCRFALHRTDLPGKPDIVMPARRIVVMVHGCFWHGHTCARGRRKPVVNAEYWLKKITRNRERDRQVRASLQREGWRVFVVWECETLDRVKVAKRFIALLARRGQDVETVTRKN